MSSVTLYGMIESTIRKAAGDSRKTIRKFHRSRWTVSGYFTKQQITMTAAAAGAGAGGLVFGTLLSGGALAVFFRCVANMTYVYGDSIEDMTVDDDDFFGVLAIWLGTQPEDVFNQALKGYKTACGSAAAGRAAEFAAKKASAKALEFLLPRITNQVLTKVATKVAAGAVPAAGVIVQAIFITNDYKNIVRAIDKFYSAKAAFLDIDA